MFVIEELNQGGGLRRRAETIAWLHLSDLHHRRPNSQRNRTHLRNARVVLDKLLEDVQGLIHDSGLQPDFIVFTGDVSFSAHPDEFRRVDVLDGFDRAADFFDRLLQVTDLSKRRLFIVPGNHDVDWKAIEENPITAAGCVARLRDRDSVTSFLAPENDRTAALGKFRNYERFVREYFEGALYFDAKEYFYVEHMSLCWRVAVLGLNSAWMSGFVLHDDRAQDKGNLLLGELQVRTALERAENADIRIALLHHPFDWLQDFDRRDVEPLLFKGCNFILRGHQHRSGIVQLLGPDGSTLVIPAGACYNRREYRAGDEEYNGYNFVRLNFFTGRGTIFWRRYDDRMGGRWAADTGLYDEAPMGQYEFDLPEPLLIRPSVQWPEGSQVMVWPEPVEPAVETILIVAGDFWMGDDQYPNEAPRHVVYLPDYWIGKYPVTNAQYRVFVEATGYLAPAHWPDGQMPPGRENHPVSNVSLYDAQAFCRWLTQTEGRRYRLPTEGEWEKAARGVEIGGRRYAWGDEWMAGAANAKEAGFGDTTPVTAFEDKNKSPFGVVDMVGNVLEWTDSRYKPYPGSKYQTGSLGPARYVVRGGCYTLPRTHARVSRRAAYEPDTTRPYLGFRIALEAE